jgi:hypothetical protein
MSLNFRKALDSGAFSLFNKYAKNKNDQTKGSDFTFFSTKKFEDYCAKWVEYVKKLPADVEYYITVDVIFNPEMSYELWKDFRKMGLRPMPVIHFGEDKKWLDKYLDDVDYVGFGGLGTRAGSVAQYDEWADGMFGRITGKDGRPIKKIHGLALTQYDLLLRYPWYSVDSTTAYRASNNGMMQIPQCSIVNGKPVFDYCGRPYWFPCTERRALAASHTSKHGAWYDKAVREYLAQYGYTLEDAAESYFIRNVVSLMYYMNLERALSEKRDFPFIFYSSGKASGFNLENAHTFFQALSAQKDPTYNYLGTFFDVKSYETITTAMENFNGKSNTRPRLKPRGPSPAQPRLHTSPHPRLLQRR